MYFILSCRMYYLYLCPHSIVFNIYFCWTANSITGCPDDTPASIATNILHMPSLYTESWLYTSLGAGSIPQQLTPLQSVSLHHESVGGQ